MKKNIALFILSIVLVGCDGLCNNIYTVTNTTSKEVLIVIGPSDKYISSKQTPDSIYIKAGESKEIFDEGLGLCGYSSKPSCTYFEGDTILHNYNYLTKGFTFDIFVNDALVNDLKLFNHWSFKTKTGTATYKLMITEQLLDDISTSK